MELHGPVESLGPDLAELGWRPFFDSQLSDEDRLRCEPVRVMAAHRGKISVAGAQGERLIPPYMSDSDAEEDHPAVGDWLLIDAETHDPVRVLGRASLFKRRAPGHARKLQLIATNVDTLFIVASCNQDFNLARLERYLVLAREVGVNPVIVLTKIDLTETPEDFAEAARALQPGLAVKLVNARDHDSVASLGAWCGKGETVALMGSSGVGKSTLVNTLTQSENSVTQAIREGDGKGRHTTTVRQMHRLEHGGWLLDTPGMRELQLSDAASGIADVFGDILDLAQNCRFSNCAHDVEPDCAVREAIANGTLAPSRLARWRGLVAEDALNTTDMAARRPGLKTGAKSGPKQNGKRK